MLDVVLVRDSVDIREITVALADGIVPADAYHPSIDIKVGHKAFRRSDSIVPSNIDPVRDWNFKRSDSTLLSKLLSEVSWHDVLEAQDVHVACRHFYETIYSIFDICIPKKCRNTGKSRRYPVWFTKSIIKDCKRKIGLHSAWK
ncbi:unnamed protein product [Euphydryas editha]|uniref:Uncharacterized protein n=1 Tax=Euphydryas editha TaxID=104508 RepID=A0AAU9TTS0_EUPED|nr:unnamed protein product [Euphydryas editha]